MTLTADVTAGSEAPDGEAPDGEAPDGEAPDGTAFADVAAALTRMCAAPQEAAAVWSALRARRPDLDLALVTETEAYDASTGYDALLRTPGGTWSLAYSPAPQLPWALRGAVRISENYLLRVNGESITVSHGLTALDMVWDDRDLLRRLIDHCLVAAHLHDHPVEVDAAAVQDAADAHRRGKGLTDPDRARDWLRERGISLRQYTAMAERTAQLRELRRRLGEDGRAQAWFADHRARFDVLVVAWVGRLAGPALVAATADGDPRRAVHAEVDAGRAAGILRRTADAMPAALRDAAPGHVVAVELDGDLAGEAVDAVVVERVPAVLDERVRARIDDLLFEQWLAGMRAEAEIEWFWLDTSRTGDLR